MKYYIIVGEASGDLHASNLIKSLKQSDDNATFRFYGGDLMKDAAGEHGSLVKHYKELAYMGFIPVLTHLGTILKSMSNCKKDIKEWNPDALILVDYPGFNLKIAKYIKANTNIPVFYYISPKIWAWKEYRIKNIKRDIDELFSILPFEIDFFNKHNYKINYVGNPSVDSVNSFLNSPEGKESREEFIKSLLTEKDSTGNTNRPIDKNKPIIALLPGSRKQEIKDNMRIMIDAVKYLKEYNFIVAAVSSIPREFYLKYIPDSINVMFTGKTYPLLHHSTAALVTSGTATLETALFKVPQVVCYYTPLGKLISFLKKLVLKVKYISLVNLIAGKEVVRELVAEHMNKEEVNRELMAILPGGESRDEMLEEYDRISKILGNPGASQRAADLMVKLIKTKYKS